MAGNAYTHRPTTPGSAPGASGGAFARPAYAVPTDADVIEGINDGYSPQLGPASEGDLPDDIRTHKREPVFGGPRTQDIEYARMADNLRRRSDEIEHSTGWHIEQRKPEIGVIPEQVQDIGPTRPTASMGPNTYLFMRPWERPESTGEHLSMADHRRKYQIYGMAPRGGVGVNTYRLDPKPWDTNLHYNPVPEQMKVQAQSRGMGGNRSYRLG